jgi:uncharacterized protein YbjT (DUF2867 family)
MILVTGATGQIGGEIVAQLPGVRAFVREPVEIEGAETVVGSFDDLGSLRTALDGIDTLFLTGRDNPDQVDQHIRVLDAARDAAVRHVVKLSAIGARADSPVALMRWHHAIEERLRASDFAWTFLRPHLFMQNLLRFAGDVAEKGVIAAPMSHREFPLVDTRDVSQAAAVVLRDPGAHAGQVYTLTGGPQALSYDDVAHAIGELVGEEAPTRHARHRSSAPACSPRVSRSGARTISPASPRRTPMRRTSRRTTCRSCSAVPQPRARSSSPTIATATNQVCPEATCDQHRRVFTHRLYGRRGASARGRRRSAER